MKHGKSIIEYLDARDDAKRLLGELAFGDTPARELAPLAKHALDTIAGYHRPSPRVLTLAA